MTIDSVKFLQWAATAKIVPNIGKFIEDEDEAVQRMGIIFDDYAYILIGDGFSEDKAIFYVLAGNEEYKDDELFPVMQWLWDNYSRDNANV